MPGVPSNKACERCKKRHLKCDETRPGCQRCAAAGVECPGYVQTRKFIDQGATVRRRYAPYQENPPRASSATRTDKATAEKASSTRQGMAQPVLKPENLQSQLVSSGPSIPNRIESPAQPSFHAPESASAGDLMQTDVTGPPLELEIATAEQTFRNPYEAPASYTVPHLSNPEEERSGSSRSAAHSPISPGDAAEMFHTPGRSYNGPLNQRPQYSRVASSGGASQHSEQEEFQDIFTELMTGTEHELAFLTRHFSDVLGPWLDLSDTEKFFAVYVPIRSMNSVFLKYAMAALAAKHLGRIKGAKSPGGGGMYSSPATMEVYPNASRVDWFLKAANYYYMAVSNMNMVISDAYASLSSSAILDSPIETLGKWLRRQTAQKDLVSPTDTPAAIALSKRTEDLLATVTILGLYKLLDAKGQDWQSHLKGIKPLFDSLLHLQSSGTNTPPIFSHGARAAFWNFARQDYLASYFNRTPTHLDPGHLPLWRAAGILIDESGDLHLHRETALENIQLSREDLAANGLIWLLSKVVNFLAKCKESQLAQWTANPPPTPSPATSTSSSENSAPTTSTWLKLCFEFQAWFEDLPETFRPCIRIEHPKDLSKAPEISHLPFPEIFYGLTVCAAAMQHYHFGRIALLLNRPPDLVSAPSTAFDRLQGYREVTKEVDYRSREICGTALGRPQGVVRIYMVPLLLAVGQCLESEEEHQIIADLLRGVEADLGWATDYTITQLQDLWNQ